MKNLIRPKRPRSHNRVAAVMSHSQKYWFKGRSLLAQDAGVSRSALSRLMSGRTHATYAVVAKVAKALEVSLGRTLDPRELVSLDGTYPTPFVCTLVGCKGCLPKDYHSEIPKIRNRWRNVPAGMWTGDNQEAKAVKWQEIKEIDGN